MSLSDTVWERTTGVDTLSERGYVAVMTFTTVFGLVIASIMAYNNMAWHPQSIWPVLLWGLALPIAGIFLAFSTDVWLLSLLGYTMVVVGLGTIIGPTVAVYKTGVVIKALSATAGVTIVMSLAGIAYPRLLNGWGGYLFASLTALLFVRIAQLFMIGFGFPETIWYMPFVEYAGAVLFTIYIMYDWGQGLRLPLTMDNAIDSSVAIFLDVANLFLLFLRIFGGSGSDDD